MRRDEREEEGAEGLRNERRRKGAETWLMGRGQSYGPLPAHGEMSLFLQSCDVPPGHSGISRVV